MAKSAADPERVEATERLDAFLTYAEKNLGLNRTALARKLGIAKSTVSNAVARNVSGDVKLALQRELGLDQRYWESSVRLEPAACMVRKADTGHLQRIIEIAKAEGESKAVLGELASLEPPHDADAWWWFREYLRIVRESHEAVSRRSKAG